MNLLHNAWLWFVLFCVALFFITQMVLSWCVGWAVQEVQTTPETHTEPVGRVLILETPILSPGLERAQ